MKIQPSAVWFYAELSSAKRKTGWREAALVVGSVAFTLLLLEGLARIWVALRWPEDRVEQMTADSLHRGRYLITGPIGYELRPSHRSIVNDKIFTHNSLGFRGDEYPVEKPRGQVRIVLMGASTVYGLVVSDQENSRAVLQRNLDDMFPDSDIAVINGAVPGWDSSDTIRSLERRVLPLEPDLIVVMDGRNEVWPQAFAGYREDYAHYSTRDPVEIAAAQSAQRRLFRTSRLAMILAHRIPGLFGYRPDLFFPVYARVRWENKPTAQQVSEFSDEAIRFRAYRDNLGKIVDKAREHSAVPVLATIFFDPDRFQTELLPATPEAIDAERRMVLRNIEITRDVARDRSVLLFDGAAITEPELMFDDCHPNEKGEEVFGRALAEVLAPVLRERTAAAATTTH